MRHGQSGSGQSLGFSSGSDRASEKTLTASGIVQIERTGKALKTLNIIPDAIVTSPLRHSRQSAEIVNNVLFSSKRTTDGKPKKRMRNMKNFQVWSIVYKNLAKFKFNSKILIIGHEPFLTKMVGEIVSSSSSSPDVRRRLKRPISGSNPDLEHDRDDSRCIILKRSGLVRISITSTSPKLKGELRWLLTPMLLKTISIVKRSRTKKNQKFHQLTSASNITVTKTKSAVTSIYQ
jgi:phosphohistidine phosphatase